MRENGIVLLSHSGRLEQHLESAAPQSHVHRFEWLNDECIAAILSARHAKLLFHTAGRELEEFQALRSTLQGLPHRPIVLTVSNDGLSLDQADILLGICEQDALLSELATASAVRDFLNHSGRLPDEHTLTIAGKTFRTHEPAMLACFEMLQVVSRGDLPVLITGETGTGKTTISRQIHALSPRAASPFAVLPCGNIVSDLLDAHLFGHLEGAFPGASGNREGKISAAGKGSLLIDEVDMLAPAEQAKLLRIVETREYERVGSVQTESSECRFMFASNVDLWERVERREFRSNLYFRINALEVSLPPLRKRSHDIPRIALALLQEIAAEAVYPGTDHLKVTLSGLRTLRKYAWPGNIRELRNTLIRTAALNPNTILDTRAFQNLQCPVRETSQGLSPPNATSGTREPVGTQSAPLGSVVAEASRDALIKCIKEHGNRKAAAARHLQISRSTLYRKLREYAIEEDELMLFPTRKH